MKGMKKEALIQRCRTWLGRRSGMSWVVLVIALGVVLMAWPSGGGEETEDATEAASQYTDPAALLEEKLEAALGQMAGVGEVTVVLTLRSSGRQVYATEVTESQQEGSSQREETVARVNTSSSTQEALEVEEEYPLYRGALVVCDGGDSAQVRLAVTESVAALTGLTSDCITVRGRG